MTPRPILLAAMEQNSAVHGGGRGFHRQDQSKDFESLLTLGWVVCISVVIYFVKNECKIRFDSAPSPNSRSGSTFSGFTSLDGANQFGQHCIAYHSMDKNQILFFHICFKTEFGTKYNDQFQDLKPARYLQTLDDCGTTQWRPDPASMLTKPGPMDYPKRTYRYITSSLWTVYTLNLI